jgi:TonB family protein
MYSRLQTFFRPKCPAEALKQNVTGPVRLRVLINDAGGVEEARVLEGHALLHEAALAAARQLRYSPTLALMPGSSSPQPVPVLTTMTMGFLAPVSPRLQVSAAVNQAASAAQAAGAERSQKAPIRVGSNVQESKLIKRVDPVYPESLRKDRIFGMVLLEVLICWPDREPTCRKNPGLQP